ncbi:toll/interleukin-1 receptor domain-containing protein [Parasphingopyxis lamellibrachiae]|uniref:TIR domain-containing protein n=1 Tax=Parasphingopyxis lamellibrachiae TaxID=680125 RepID=A0A3D9FDW4_9SPHN|nr:toll/interleukin-1 receptor domain-containing protein [Parasphingopyxis lamellibrachiae]RED15858.1 TIR domain-containing protein [Parasphingopyxis lamellibrachiae]
MRIFISYRREDSKHSAGRLADALGDVPHIKSAFLDIDDIAAGESFPERLEASLGQADVCLVLMGDRWVGPVDDGEPRINRSGDFVRMEVASALASDMRVIPLILDDAPMPDREMLPEDVQPLLERNALFLRHHSFSQDVDFLVDALQGRTGPRRRRRPVLRAIVRSLGGVALGLLHFLGVAILNRAVTGQNLETSLGGLPMLALLGSICLAVGLAISFGAIRKLRGG